jgi:hypothetical protein
MLKKIALLVISLLTVALMLAAVACGSEPKGSISEKEAVPQRANLIARISLESALADNGIRNVYDKVDKGTDVPATFDEFLQMFREQTGLDLKGFKEATLFGDITDPSQILPEQGVAPSEGYLGVIVSGTFKKDELIAAIEKGTGQKLESEAYKGYDIYTGIEENSGAESASLAFLDEGVFVVGSVDAVKDVIDVKNGGKEGLGDDLLEAYEKLDGSWGKLALNIPGEWLSQLPDEQDIGGIGTLKLKAFKEMRMATAALDRAGDNFSLEIRVAFSGGASASGAKDAIDGFINVLQGLIKLAGGSGDIPEMAALTDLLNSLHLSVSGNWLTLRLELTTEQVEELMPMLQGMSSGD